MPSEPRPTLFLLHALGTSRREFDLVGAALDGRFEMVQIDLAGFGDASTSTGTTVEDMRTEVLERIRRHGATRWMLVGHSMGGKIASAVAARVMAGAPGVFGLAGVVLLAASPPVPEPMDEDRRAEMLGWARSTDGRLVDHLSADAARTFIDANVGSPLDPARDDSVRADLLRASPEAWTDWLTTGSREDWSHDVGTLDVPALIVAGGADGDLGPDAQRSLNGAVYPGARFLTLDGAGHLLPLERPDEVADAIAGFWDDVAGRAPIIPEDVVGTIASGRTSARTRSILAARALADDPDRAPEALTTQQLATLRALADRVVPQGPFADGTAPIDIAARVDAQLAAGAGDGWRNAMLPPDRDAYGLGLDALAGFTEMTAEDQDARIGEIVDSSFVPEHGDSAGAAGVEQHGATDDGDSASTVFSAAQMTIWFEDARVDLVRQWLAHPATMARIGFDGFANGGDGTRLQGFQLLGADEKEGWEPRMETATSMETTR
ncbi:alpha/beta hydrolase [Curtobacterium sp. Leaf261]|uniref:alpha/beta hydrolase n=1 Tax=Curtobacterium sp. Leaf261 TaxID=1736311 RepID=UPI0006F8E335|nr:alpha/beta hydrolase [Curtobacterium sp. Leaf261]KQO61422.1 hypothetical protein ASF23_13200 [Curtobacterium sp. Leaf261]